MDVLRFGYTTYMRTSTECEPIKVRWYRAAPGAPVYPNAHRFYSRNWKDLWEYPSDQIGEQTETCCERKVIDWYNSAKPPGIITGRTPCGSPTAFHNGGGPDDPLFVVGDGGASECCIHPCDKTDTLFCFTIGLAGGPFFSVVGLWAWQLSFLGGNAFGCTYEQTQFVAANGDAFAGYYQAIMIIANDRTFTLDIKRNGTTPYACTYAGNLNAGYPVTMVRVSGMPSDSDWPATAQLTLGPCVVPILCPGKTHAVITPTAVTPPFSVTLTQLANTPTYQRYTLLDFIRTCAWVLTNRGGFGSSTLHILSLGSADHAQYRGISACSSQSYTLHDSTGVCPFNGGTWPIRIQVFPTP